MTPPIGFVLSSSEKAAKFFPRSGHGSEHFDRIRMASSARKKAVVKSVRRLYKEEPWAARLFESLAQRKNNPSSTTIDRLMRLLALTLSEATAAAKQLQEAGCGTYFVGRKGYPSRFEWEFSAISLGLAAMGQVDTIVGMAEEGAEGEMQASLEASKLKLTIQEAKEALARNYGVRADQVEITIKG